MGNATISLSSATLRTSSMDSTKWSFIELRICSGMSGRSFGTLKSRSASFITLVQTGPAVGPPIPRFPVVPLIVTIATSAGLFTGANPMNDALYR